MIIFVYEVTVYVFSLSSDTPTDILPSPKHLRFLLFLSYFFIFISSRKFLRESGNFARVRPLCCRLSWDLQRLLFPNISPGGEGFPETFVDFPGRKQKWQDLRGHLCGFSSANGRLADAGERQNASVCCKKSGG